MAQQIVRSDDGYQAAKDLARDNVCANGHELVVKWSADGHYVAVCLHDECDGVGIRPRRDVYADELRERLERNPEVARSMVPVREVPLTTRAIRELDNEKLMARVPTTGTDQFGNSFTLSKDLRLKLAQLARVYGLDPIWDLCILQGQPYVTYDGRLRKLREHPEYRGHKVRPLNREEKDQWGYKSEDLVIQADVDMGPRGIITDWGIVRASEVKEALDRAAQNKKQPAPVGKHPQQIAIKRAVSRASKQAVGIDLPTVIESAPGRIVDIQEVPRHPLAPAEIEAQARGRFWAIARGSPPDGLGLSDADVHRLLGVETLTDYPGGWDQALSDLTERAAADEDMPQDDAAEAQAAPAEENGPEDTQEAEPERSALVASYRTLLADAARRLGPAFNESEWTLAEDASDEEVESRGVELSALVTSTATKGSKLRDQAFQKNAALLADATAAGLAAGKGLRTLKAQPSDSLEMLIQKNAELGARLQSRAGEEPSANTAQQGAF